MLYTNWFITSLTWEHPLSPSWARWTPISSYLTSWSFKCPNICTVFRYKTSLQLFRSIFSIYHFSVHATCSAHPIPTDPVNLIAYGEVLKSWNPCWLKFSIPFLLAPYWWPFSFLPQNLLIFCFWSLPLSFHSIQFYCWCLEGAWPPW